MTSLRTSLTASAALLAVLTLMATLLRPPAPAGANSDGAPMLVGVTIGGDWRSELSDFTSQLGRSPAIWGLYWTPELFETSPPWAAGMLEELHGHGLTGWIEWTTDDLAGLASGALDDRLRNLFATIDDFTSNGPGRGVVLAPLPEANLDEHPWSGDPVAFQQAFRRMRRLAAEAGLTSAEVRFAFPMNGHSTPGRSYAQFYPGDEHVDLLAFARLNRGPGHPDGWRAFEDVFTGPLDDLVKQIGSTKPIFVAQTGSVAVGGDRAAWIRDLFERLPEHPQVIGASWFNRNPGSNDFRIHHRADGIPLDPAYRDGARSWSTPDRARWLFDGSLDQWVGDRGGVPASWPPDATDQPAAQNPFGSDQAVTTRIGGATPIDNAVRLSQVRFVPDDARHVVLSREDKFPDALAGTPLLGEGPLLLTPTATLDARSRSELDRVLAPGATVYLLGGTKALAPAIEAELDGAGYDVRRLSGPDRFATARAVATEVRSLYPESADTVLVARGYGTDSNPTAAWADSVTGGGFAAANRHPVVLSLSHELSSDAAAVLDGAARAFLLGGRSALQDGVLADVAARVGTATRISGAARDATAVQVTTELWGVDTRIGRFILIDGYSDQGWAFGLPAAGLAAEFAAPLLPVSPTVLPPDTAAAVTSCFTKRIATVVIGSSAVISEDVRLAVEARDRSC